MGMHLWLTLLDCDGSPLPSLGAPYCCQYDGPAMASHACQKSVVRAWYATRESMLPFLPFLISQNASPPNWKLYRCWSIEKLPSPSIRMPSSTPAISSSRDAPGFPACSDTLGMRWNGTLDQLSA